MGQQGLPPPFGGPPGVPGGIPVPGPPMFPTSPTSKVRIDSELVERETSPTSETHMTWFGSVSSAIFPDDVRYVARPSTNLTFASHLSARSLLFLLGWMTISTIVPRT